MKEFYQINIDFDLKILKDYIVLHVIIDNQSTNTIYLNPDWNPIEIRELTKNTELFQQEYINRDPYKWSEYVEIFSGETYQKTFQLNSIFYFVYGCHNYCMNFHKGYYSNENLYNNMSVELIEFSWCNPVLHENFMTFWNMIE